MVDFKKIVKIAGPILKFLYNQFLAGKAVKIPNVPVPVTLPPLEVMPPEMNKYIMDGRVISLELEKLASIGYHQLTK